jgi:hypothetical protein
MTSPTDALPPLGFVVALRATIVGHSGRIRPEWLIASRWSPGGAYLSIARTLIPAASATDAPQHLVPRWSFLAFLQTGDGDPASPSFDFAEQCPTRLKLAGRFTPAVGNVRLEGIAGAMQLRGTVRCSPERSGQIFQFDGVRVPWVGEFIEMRS